MKQQVDAPHWPDLQRTAAFVLVLIQLVAIRALMPPPAWPFYLFAVIGWLAPVLRIAMPIPPVACNLVIFAAYLARYRYVPQEFFIAGFIGTELAYEAAMCCVTIQIAAYYLAAYRRRLPAWILALSGAGLVFTGDVRVTSNERAFVLGLTGLYFLFWGMYAASSRSSVSRSREGLWFRFGVIGLVLAVAFVTHRVLAVQLHRNESKLERIVQDYLVSGNPPTTRTGFSGQGGLSDIRNWKRWHADEPSLRIDSEVCPGYLRGQTFELFSRYQWHSSVDIAMSRDWVTDRVEPADSINGLFQLRPYPVSDCRTMTVWPFEVETSYHCFAPLDLVAVACSSRTLHVFPSGVIHRDASSGMGPYELYISTTPLPAARRVNADDLTRRLPRRLDPYVLLLADEVCGSSKTVPEKIQAVESFFHQNFQYHMGVEIPEGENRLTYFLKHRVPAHCEYFATGAAILLRAAGVPTRYVTGYLVTEQSSLDGSWVARHNDSHAWVEAYDAQQDRWLTVEATPTAGRPTADSISRRRGLWEALLNLWKRTYADFASGRIWRRLSWLVGPLIGMILLIIGLRGIWNGKRIWKPRRKAVRSSAELSRLRRELAKFDRSLGRRGLQRPDEETLSRFAERLEASSQLDAGRDMANWYRHYQVLRYSDQPVEEREIDSLAQARRTLTRQRGIKR